MKVPVEQLQMRDALSTASSARLGIGSDRQLRAREPAAGRSLLENGLCGCPKMFGRFTPPRSRWNAAESLLPMLERAQSCYLCIPGLVFHMARRDAAAVSRFSLRLF